MSDEPKKRSHTVRLAVSMLLGVFAGVVFLFLVVGPLPLGGGRTHSFAPLICTALGTLVGFAVEMLRRLLEAPAHTGPEGINGEAWSGNARQSKSITLNRCAGFGMFVGGPCFFLAALMVTDSEWDARWLFLSLMSLFGAVVGGMVGLLLGLVPILFIRWRHSRRKRRTRLE